MILIGCALFLMLALHLGVRYGNPMDATKPLDERLSPAVKTGIVCVSIFLICTATGALLWLSMKPDSFVFNTPNLLTSFVKDGAKNVATVTK